MVGFEGEAVLERPSGGRSLPAEDRARSSREKQIPSSAPKKSYHFDATFFIQTAGLVYHHRTKCGGYHQPLMGLDIITPRRVSFLRFDDIQHSVLMIYRNKWRMIYKAYALIFLKLCAIIYLKR